MAGAGNQKLFAGGYRSTLEGWSYEIKPAEAGCFESALAGLGFAAGDFEPLAKHPAASTCVLY
jgi:hypothetical protein